MRVLLLVLSLALAAACSGGETVTPPVPAENPTVQATQAPAQTAGHPDAPHQGASEAAGAPADDHGEHSAASGPRRSRAQRLVGATRRSLRRWSDLAVAENDGFRSLGDDEDRFVHYLNANWMLDGSTLAPRRPESLVYETTDDGPRLVSAMYVMPLGTRMDRVPDLGDERVRWHTHDDLCFGVDGTLSGRLVDGECRPGGINVKTPPMLHVWIVDHPCGPFAGLGERSGGCAHDH